jgi:hypothetical protein
MARARGRPVLGIAISGCAMHAILLHGDRISWHHAQPIGADGSFESAMNTVLNVAPHGQWTKPAVSVAVGPARAQLRRLKNLPAVRRRRILADIVQQSAGRYFLQNGIPVVTTELIPAHDGDRWAGAIEAPVVAAIRVACEESGYRLVRLSPTAALLGFAIRDGSVCWRDGDVTVQAEYDVAQLVSCRRRPTSDDGVAPDHGVLDTALLALGNDAFEFAGAYAAARGAYAPGVSIPATLLGRHAPARWRLLVAGMACVAAMAFAAASPAIAAGRREHLAVGRLTRMRTTDRAASVEAHALADSVRILAELSGFRASSPSTLCLLASLTRAVEAPTTLVTLRLDDSGGTLTAVTPSTADLLGMLEKVAEISGPTISGAVAPEAPAPVMGVMSGVPGMPIGGPAASATTVEQDHMERVTIRFHWNGERSERRVQSGVRAP